MADNKLNMSGSFGGLMRYDDEFASKFQFSPKVVVGFVIAVVLLVFVLKVFYPVP